MEFLKQFLDETLNLKTLNLQTKVGRFSTPSRNIGGAVHAQQPRLAVRGDFGYWGAVSLFRLQAGNVKCE